MLFISLLIVQTQFTSINKINDYDITELHRKRNAHLEINVQNRTP